MIQGERPCHEHLPASPTLKDLFSTSQQSGHQVMQMGNALKFKQAFLNKSPFCHLHLVVHVDC